jgi:hypothetical protein
MPFDPKLALEQHYVEAWGLWWLEWQQWTKERLRRHTMSTQTRLKEFEARHLVSSRGEGLLGDAATSSANASVLPSK